MKLQIFKILALLNAAASVSATTAAGAPPIANLNRAHGTNELTGRNGIGRFVEIIIGLFDFSFFPLC